MNKKDQKNEEGSYSDPFRSPPPPPNWEDDSELYISQVSSPGRHQSPLTEMIIIELDGKKYYWDGQDWYDSTHIKPPQFITRQLNTQFQSRIESEDAQLTSVTEMLKRSRQARENHQLERAEKLVRRAMTLEPDNHACAAVLCATLRARHKPYAAIEETNRYIMTHHAPLLTSRAAAYCDLELWARAKKTIGRALAIDSSEEALMVMNRIKAARPDLYSKD